MTTTIYRILCEVSGGVTGHRTAYMRKADDALYHFDTRAEAEAKLPPSLTTDRGVRFTYSIVEWRVM